MNGFCRTLSGFFGAIQATDCPSDGYLAVEVYQDDNPTYHGHYDTEEEAEDRAAEIHAERIAEHSQFGVGA